MKQSQIDSTEFSRGICDDKRLQLLNGNESEVIVNCTHYACFHLFHRLQARDEIRIKNQCEITALTSQKKKIFHAGITIIISKKFHILQRPVPAQ